MTTCAWQKISMNKNIYMWTNVCVGTFRKPCRCNESRTHVWSEKALQCAFLKMCFKMKFQYTSWFTSIKTVMEEFWSVRYELQAGTGPSTHHCRSQNWPVLCPVSSPLLAEAQEFSGEFFQPRALLLLYSNHASGIRSVGFLLNLDIGMWREITAVPMFL